MNIQRLPQTDSIQELANFWDTHDLTEFEDDLEEVGERVFKRDAEITVHLEMDDANTVRAMAKSRGVRDSELIREWVLERLHVTWDVDWHLAVRIAFRTPPAATIGVAS